MTKSVRIATAALAFTALLSAAPAAAQQASAAAVIRKPLTLTSKQNLSFGDILVTASGTFQADVEVAANGAVSCPAAYFTCGGTRVPAIYNVSGNKSQNVKLTVDSTITLQNTATPPDTLTMTVLLPASGDVITLTNSGYPGTDVNLGGRLRITQSTQDGSYSGSFNVTVNYQ
jgi:hypothetical protein